ncbi:MAG: prolipoprotein diacylglyceryl transferase [Pyrinomonadaceae bacterium]
MQLPYVHNIDPIIFTLFGVHLWWYGLSFTLGFLNAHIFLRRNRKRFGLSLPNVYDLTLFLAAGVLIGGRLFIVIINEWEFYKHNLTFIPRIWSGGFASHGLLFGGAAGVLIFCLLYKKPIRPMFDVLAISAAIILGFGRIGNFIDGQIYGSLTDMTWGVRFPEVEGFRHPVVLYDGIKNFLLVPLLLWIRSRGVPPGRIAVLFVIFYALFRIPIDLLRDYPISLWGIPTGQGLNFVMLLAGVVLLAVNIMRSKTAAKKVADNKTEQNPKRVVFWRRFALVFICALPLIIPSDATRDIPHTYGNRHPGLEHSIIYPAIQKELDRSGPR